MTLHQKGSTGGTSHTGCLQRGVASRRNSKVAAEAKILAVESPGPSLDLSGCSVSTTASVDPVCPHQQKLRLATGSATLQGCKSSGPTWRNQDRSLVMELPCGVFVVGVFDGHGVRGDASAERMRVLVERQAPRFALLSRSQLGEEFTKFFRQAHATLDAEGLARFSGTTATVAVIDPSAWVVTVAHAGDSSLMMSCGGEVEFVTAEHRVDAHAEQRVLAHGGEVRATCYGDVWTRRVYARGQRWPGLAMARSIGDAEAHAVGVVCEPEINTFSLDVGSTLVVASDGVWDKLSSQEVADYAAVVPCGASAPPSVARAIVTKARSRWHSELDIDDITAVVVQACA